MIKNENFVVILGFMINDLHLKGNELLIYAIIYGFCQEEGQEFTGSLKYLSQWTGASKSTIMSTLKSLVDKGLISKRDEIRNGVRFCAYHTENYTTIPKVATGYTEIDTGGISEFEPNNIYKYNNYNIEREEREETPTLAEIKSFIKDNDLIVDAERFYNHYSQNGWKVGSKKIDDWKAVLMKWDSEDRKKAPRKPKVETKETANYDLSKWTGLEISGGGI